MTSIRTATVADLDQIMAIERAAFPRDAWSESSMRAELASPHGRYVVDEQAGRVVGYAGLRALPGARDADVQTIVVAEASRGHGRGRALLHELLAEAERHVARYKLPKAFVYRETLVRSPAGKADYRWAKAQATEG